MSSLTQKAHGYLQSAQRRYESRNPKSRLLHEQATLHLPGGNTRSVLHGSPFPLCMARGEGNRLFDHDGHEYLDLSGDMTAGLCGHSHPVIHETITSTMCHVGLNLGATTIAEAQFAEAICNRFSSIEQLRFCNSGTEANLYALSVARQITELSKVIVFEGGYHGGVLYFSHGVAPNDVDKEDWIVAPYNNPEEARRIIGENKDVAAAVLVEAMQCAGGCIPGTARFLHTVQDAARENGVLFILDEVATSRLAPGGLQAVVLHPERGTSLTPDMTTLGKWIGGGLTIGAFGGRQDLLSVYDPRCSNIHHSGTFNNNTLAMNVGYKTITSVYNPEACIALNKTGDQLRRDILKLAKGTRMVVTGVGGVLNFHFTPSGAGLPVTTIHDVDSLPESVDAVIKDLLWFYLVERGFWIARRGMLSLILGTTQEETQRFQNVVHEFLQEFWDLVKL